MGCFDTVTFRCPSCGKQTSEQSKAGGCDLKTYSLAKAPLRIISDLESMGERGTLKCDHCHIQLVFVVQRIVEVAVKDASNDDEDDSG